ncbi:TIGR02680 family protein [Paraburkholderia edwinii]|uniref:TIGR02680 family protein n=1 Tax=Paraburkholderia edwinii TaxID=2861782 RepID=A0ABX8UKB1_9BURK|nr:TIGR02680 family protein [Paraburkholderia edwinii]QYD69031.1 TIGR02680 family protein [Paraburkholderia edwinii]
MSEHDNFPAPIANGVQTLPEPSLERWQPLRVGVLELFHYDSEEFWFHDGHLLLRGNNGTGKSKVLSLTLPFLFDANLRPNRVEPDGDSGKRMAWNLLVGSYKRRIGYTWIEFGRRDREGQMHYLTLGAGLSAVEGKPSVDAWFFMLAGGLTGGSRIGRDFWLTNQQGTVLTRDRLRETIDGHGKLYDNAALYRHAVDERLFNLGEKRYDALMDTLIQLRQPQLSRKPDEAGLSHALTEALPPMPQALLTDVAEALNQLEEDRQQLDNIKELHGAVQHFNRRYERYARIQSRRQARELRQAQTEFDNASQSRNAAHDHLEAAQAAEINAVEKLEAGQLLKGAARARLETLQSNPTMQDANRLENAEKDLERRNADVTKEEEASSRASQLRDTEARRTNEYVEEVRSKGAFLIRARGSYLTYAETARLAREVMGNILLTTDPAHVASINDREFDQAAVGLRNATSGRRDAIKTLKDRIRDVEKAQVRLREVQRSVEEAKFDVQEATERRADADMEAERTGQTLVDAWVAYSASLQQLEFDSDQHIATLADWVAKPDGENPARKALQGAYQHRQTQLASAEADLARERQMLRARVEELENERAELNAGRDPAPPAPHTRSEQMRTARSGAPFWRVVDFKDKLDDAQRAGLEAALEASGLLDAWVEPDGQVSLADGKPWLDSHWSTRPVTPAENLADWLQSDCGPETPVSAETVERLLRGVACGQDDDAACEAWVSPSGLFRLGPLSGDWSKPQALYIGQSARAKARDLRLEAIRAEIAQLESMLARVMLDLDNLLVQRSRAALELSSAPADTELLAAMQSVAVAMRDFMSARARLDRVEAQCREAEDHYRAASDRLARDAEDSRLPTNEVELAKVEEALVYCMDSQNDMLSLIRECRRLQMDLERQRAHMLELDDRYQESLEKLASVRQEAEELRTRFETLKETIGVVVASLRAKLAEARNAVDESEQAERTLSDQRRVAGEHRAAAVQKLEDAQATLDTRAQARADAIAQLQRFASSNLLLSALPELEIPELANEWTIDPALTLARRVEQSLSDIKDDDHTWNEVQKQVNEVFMDLQRSLTALGHQVVAETSDWGLVVHVTYHRRQERPGQLAASLADEISQRSELLSAHERSVLENHLQAEIASEIQHMLRAAEQQVVAVNKELEKRPTSTGVRYRLLWQPLTEAEGAPIGLELARKRLLNTSSDLWTSEDRQVVGNMLQLQIKSERDRADSGDILGGTDTGVSLFDQLSRALDYRRWHRFRVERYQGGQWRKLSGPASSGERALGLTVPLFAAIASFYSRSGNPHAPRLMLLDEAFAGIDNLARAHCMGLIREFDLDFVITSEREWACYAELPGVAICQLQRREGVDAVHVSRWIWDGKSRRSAPDPERHLSPS